MTLPEVYELCGVPGGGTLNVEVISRLVGNFFGKP